MLKQQLEPNQLKMPVAKYRDINTTSLESIPLMTRS
jgi:hypothetical protein